MLFSLLFLHQLIKISSTNQTARETCYTPCCCCVSVSYLPGKRVGERHGTLVRRRHPEPRQRVGHEGKYNPPVEPQHSTLSVQLGGSGPDGSAIAALIVDDCSQPHQGNDLQDAGRCSREASATGPRQACLEDTPDLWPGAIVSAVINLGGSGCRQPLPLLMLLLLLLLVIATKGGPAGEPSKDHLLGFC